MFWEYSDLICDESADLPRLDLKVFMYHLLKLHPEVRVNATAVPPPKPIFSRPGIHNSTLVGALTLCVWQCTRLPTVGSCLSIQGASDLAKPSAVGTPRVRAQRMYQRTSRYLDNCRVFILERLYRSF